MSARTTNQMVRDFQEVLGQTATLLSFPNSPAIDRIQKVQQAAAELYDERDEDGHHRDLEVFEALFISASNALTKSYGKVRAEGHRTWGDGAAYDALCSLTYREQADMMEAALATYMRAREDHFNDEVEGVRHAMAAAE